MEVSKVLSGTGAVVLAASAVLVLVLSLCLTWVVRLRRALADARRATERERAVSERERANAAEERALAAERGEEVARLAAVQTDLDEAARRERILRDSVQASFESVARNMHAMSMVQQQVLDGLEQYVEDAGLMGEVMKADHAAAQMTRKAQTLLVMCGIWPARRETRPVSLFDCVRGAQSRIVEFGRVDVHGGQTLYAVAPAVEGLMHAVAELLENATVFSPSRTQVAVAIREVAAGAVIEIDDAGLGMPPDVLEKAVGQLRDGLDLAQLGAVPRLGLACVGRWSRELGFGVELSTASAYGGTRVVVFVPHRLLTEQTSAVRAADHRPVVVEPVVVGKVNQDAGGAGLGPAAADPAGGRLLNGVSVDDIPDLPDVPDAPASPGTGLPRRRNRRRPASGAAPASRASSTDVAGGADGTDGTDGPDAVDATDATDAVDLTTAPARAAPTPPPAAAPWTPEAARASITSVVSGTRRGRVEAEAEAVPPDDESSPDREDREGGR
ncbi:MULTISPECIES: ATP-binding protein [Streptomyces violaceusniger group]|uniref:ATP-binding protein n=1 Tax=Streptomyces violaceusniger group TaxID=2839105 RepID=UPI001FD5ACA9|nr:MULTISPECIES: ATP-binding protein [Streptomyces violaceusniger group]